MGRIFYLCQHGDALDKEIDPDRPLSERGTLEVCNVASMLSGSVEIGGIIHSGKTRARQTAELLHERLAPEVSLDEESGLGPNDPVDDFAAGLASRPANVLMVGHRPFVDRLACLLLCHAAGADRTVLAFKPGAVAALEAEGDDWRLAWMVTPALCR